MKWSKVKKTAESLLADSLRGRIAYHVTRYGPGVSYMATRAWVTLDKREILNASTDQWLQGREGAISRDQFTDALQAYLDQPIDDALVSPDPTTRALAMFDRRMGKRRLREITFSADEHPLVRQFYQIRCNAEGLVRAGSLKSGSHETQP